MYIDIDLLCQVDRSSGIRSTRYLRLLHQNKFLRFIFFSGLFLPPPPPPSPGNMNEPQNCPHCRRTFSCYYSLKRHFQDKHEYKNTIYVCEFCHRRYRTKNSLTTHKSLQHRGSSGMLKRLIRSTTSNHLTPAFAPQIRSTSLLFESIMYNHSGS